MHQCRNVTHSNYCLSFQQKRVLCATLFLHKATRATDGGPGKDLQDILYLDPEIAQITDLSII